MHRVLLAVSVGVALLVSSACSPSPSPRAVSEAPPGGEVLRDVSSFSALTYNVLCGAGVTGDVQDCQRHGRQEPGDKVDELTAFLAGIDVDVFAIQEAQGWASSEAGTAEEIAELLGMRVVVGESPDTGNHVALFARDEIQAATTYSDGFSRAVLHASIDVVGTGVVDVVVLHLTAGGDNSREFSQLIELLKPLGSGPTILLGDFNLRDEADDQLAELAKIGFQQAARHGPDFIFVTDEVGRLETGGRYIEPLDLGSIPTTVSDHDPVGVTMGR